MSDFSDSDTETSSDETQFSAAAAHLERIHGTLQQADLLALYGLYKQSTCGQCNTPKPSFFNPQARTKWSAWNDLGAMSKADAQRTYVEKLSSLDPTWAERLRAGELPKKTSWVVQSVEIAPEDLRTEAEKTIVDFVKEGNLKRVQETLTPADLLALDEDGMGLIHWATDRNWPKLLTHLIATGADVDLRDADGQTPLHYAASCGHVDCIHILLRNRANSGLRDGDNQTCLDVAETPEVRALLEQ